MIFPNFEQIGAEKNTAKINALNILHPGKLLLDKQPL